MQTTLTEEIAEAIWKRRNPKLHFDKSDSLLGWAEALKDAESAVEVVERWSVPA